MKIDSLTPGAAMLAELGRRLAHVRKQQGLSQEQLAAAAGVGVATLRRIEDGKDGKLGSWLRLLVALRMESSIDTLLPENYRSPMAEAGRARRGAKGKPPPTGAAGDGPGEGDRDGVDFVWGDQRP